MKPALRLHSCLVAFAGSSLLAVAALGAEQGGEAEKQTIGMYFKWIHFFILAALFYWVFGKLLPPAFRRNADAISSAISKAATLKAEAEKRLQEAATKLASLENEVAKFKAQAQQDAAAELERLRAATQSDVAKVRTAARAETEAAERAARVELKELAAKLAVDGAESLVAQQMTPAVQEAMISSFVQSLQRRPN
jgi:F-type H+-transporting ATPase subunit b